MRHLIASSLLLALAVAAPAAAGARHWHGCAAQPPHASRLATSHLRCSAAARAVRAGRFELTPGGPQLHTRGFRCTTPVGPRRGYTVCTAGTRAFRFIYTSVEPGPGAA